jgi:ATP-binding cassette, subfamily D (ALD), member 3
MAPALSTLSSKKNTVGSIALVLFFTLYRNKQAIAKFLQSTLKEPSNTKASTRSQKKSVRKKVGVNATFFRQMAKLLPICIPSAVSRETSLLAALAIVLIARTWLDIWFSAFNG